MEKVQSHSRIIATHNIYTICSEISVSIFMLNMVQSKASTMQFINVIK